MCLDDRLDFIKCTLTHTAKLIQCAPRPCHVIVLLSYSELILSHSNHLVIFVSVGQCHYRGASMLMISPMCLRWEHKSENIMSLRGLGSCLLERDVVQF